MKRISQIVKGLAEGVTDEFILNFSETKVNIGKMIAGVIANTDVKETPEFIKQLICDSVVSPKLRDEAQLFETHFAGNYEDLSDLLVEIIIFNGFSELVKKNLLALTGFLQENV